MDKHVYFPRVQSIHHKTEDSERLDNYVTEVSTTSLSQQTTASFAHEFIHDKAFTRQQERKQEGGDGKEQKKEDEFREGAGGTRKRREETAKYISVAGYMCADSHSSLF